MTTLHRIGGNILDVIALVMGTLAFCLFVFCGYIALGCHSVCTWAADRTDRWLEPMMEDLL